MKAQDLMSRDVVTVQPDDTIIHAARLMLQKRISGLPVVDAAGALAGIVTEGDFLRRAETGTVRRRPRWLEFILGPGRLAGEYAHAAGRYVKEVMTSDVHTVTEATPLEEIISLMERNRIKRVPVVRGQKVVGIVTRQNLLRAVADVAVAARPAAPTDDEAIRERLVNEVRQQPWAPLIFDPVVANGNVKLVGTVFDDRQREALRIIAENVPGVKSIEDELVWIEPTSGIVIQPAAA